MDGAEKKIPFAIPAFIKAIFFATLGIIILVAAFLIFADVLPEPIRQTAIDLRTRFIKNTGGELTSTWVTEEDECTYILFQNNVAAARMEGTCTLEIFDGSALRANLIFTYKSYTYITSNSSARLDVQKIEIADRSLRYHLKDAKLDKDTLVLKSFSKQGTIHEFTFILGEKDVKTQKVNVIPGLESDYVKFESDTMVFKLKRQKILGIF